MSFPRYPKYKDSGVEWLGEVPEHWEVKPLKAVSTHNDDVLDETTAPETEILYVDISNVDGVNGINAKEIMLFSAAPSRARRRVKHGDVIVSTVRTYLRAIARIREPEDNLVVSTGFAVVRPRYALVPDFLGNVLSAGYFVEQVIARSAGVSYPAINASELVAIPITVPPKDEQTQIAEFLDRETAKIDELVGEQRRLMELLKEKRQAVISHAVTKGLNPNAPMKPSGIEWLGEVPSHWIVSRLGFESWVRARLGWKGLKAEEYVDDGFAFLSTPNIKGLEIDFKNVNFITQERFDESPEIKIRESDVLLAKDGSTLGTVNVVRQLPRPTTVNSSIAVITPNERLNGVFLFYYFGSSYTEQTIQRTKGGMGVPHLFQADLNKFYLPVPPIEEQIRIANFLDREITELDTLTAEAQRVIDLLQERRTALISAAVTGQIDVRTVRK